MILNFCDSSCKTFCLVLFLWRSHTVVALVMLITTAEYDSSLMQPMLFYLRGRFAQQLAVIDELLIFFWLLNLVIVMSITKCCFGLVYINVVSTSLALELKWIHIWKWAWSTSLWFTLVFSKILLHSLWIKYHGQGRVKSIFRVGMGEAISLMNLVLEFPCGVFTCSICTILSLRLGITHWWAVWHF